MSEFKVRFDTNNAAFEDEGEYEIALILKLIAGRMEDGDFHRGHSRNVFDSNGNVIGTYKWTP
jgi:hypothetical protein